MKHVKEFFDYAKERESIRIRRGLKGSQPPFTQDPILQKYRFCNVFREDDTVTTWIRENLRKPLENEWNLMPVMAAARFINRVETLQALKDILLEEGWHSVACKAMLYDLRKQGKPLITGAYMVRTPWGMNKIEGLDKILSPLQEIVEHGQQQHAFPEWETLQEAHAWFMELDHFGKFMAYEIVTDLRHTPLLNKATDIMTWANAGPGAARGMSRVEFGEIGHYNYGSDKHQVILNQKMQELLEHSKNRAYWPRQWPKWEMRDVEHTLCEYDKYMRIKNGEGEPKQLFRPLASGVQHKMAGKHQSRSSTNSTPTVGTETN